jgi:hypothetical protein
MHGYVSLEAIHFNIFAIVLMVLNFSWVLIVTIECWFVWRFKVVLGRHWLRSVTIVLLCGAIFFTLTGISAVATDILPIQVSIGGSLINKWLPQSFLFHVMVFDPNSSINPHYQYVLSSGSWLFILIACLFVVSSFYVMLDYKTKIKMANVLGFRHISELNK